MKTKIIKEFEDGYYIQACQYSNTYCIFYELKKKRKWFWDESISWNVNCFSLEDLYQNIQRNKQIYDDW